MMERIAKASPRLKARIAGIFCLLAFLTGVHSTGHYLQNVLYRL